MQAIIKINEKNNRDFIYDKMTNIIGIVKNNL